MTNLANTLGKPITKPIESNLIASSYIIVIEKKNNKITLYIE